ncbi:MAG: transcriptional regulator [Candidatus Ranarchaeia archaeon]|jgi:putative transcriptional regulator
MTSDRMKLIKEVLGICRRVGFEYSVVSSEDEKCFEVVAQKKGMSFLFKLMENIDQVSEENAQELSRISYHLPATPVIIGEKTRSKEIQDSAVYDRHDIPAVNLETLRAFMVEKILPVLSAKRGGYYVKVQGEKLRKERVQRNLSLGDLAREGGVSRRTIYEYERGKMDASIETIMRLEKFIQKELAEPIDLLEYGQEKNPPPLSQPPKDPLKRIVDEKISDLGMNPQFMQKAPFDAIIPSNQGTILLGVGETEQQEKNRIWSTGEIAGVLHKTPVYVLSEREDMKSEPIHGVSIMELEELRAMKKPNEFLKLLLKKQRTRNQ